MGPTRSDNRSPPPLDGRAAAERLRAHRDGLIEAFVDLTRRELAAARALDHDGVVDTLPVFLDNLADALERGEDPSTVARGTDIGHHHGEARAGQPYTLRDVLVEYRLLSRLVFALLRGGAQLDQSVEDIVNDAIHRGIANSATTFERLRSEAHQQREQERERLVAELQDARSLLETVIRHVPVGIAVTDARTGRSLLYNEAIERLTERAVSERRTLDEYARYGAIHADGTAYTPDDYPTTRVLRRGETVRDEEMLYRLTDGSLRTLVVSSTPVRAPDGGVQLAITTAYDVTDRRRLETELRDAEERLRLALDAAEMGTWRLRVAEGVVERDATLNRILGLEARDGTYALGEFLERVHPDDRERVAAGLSATSATGAPHGVEFRILRGDQEARWLRSQAKLHRDAAGRATYVTGAVVDITGQVSARHAIESERQRLYAALMDAPVAIAVHRGPEATFEFANHQYRAVLAPHGDVVGRPLADALPALEPEVVAVHARVYETGASYADAERPVRFDYAGDGRPYERIWNLTIEPLRGPDGAIVGVLTCAYEVTDQVRARQALETANQGLQAERELRERFVATLSHDLRTPLTAARMSAQILARKGPEPNVLQRLTGRIVDNIDRADHMIRDLLDANRIRAGERLPIEVSACAATPVIEAALDELSTVHGDRFVLQAADPVEGTWSCAGIRRIVENLCTNAVKYGAPGQPITVTVASTAGGMTLAVHNVGPPIPAEDLPHLFEPFRRSRSAEAGPQVGWGLGLTLVRGLAEAHGGSVRVDSSADRGTTFTVDLRDMSGATDR